MSKHCAVRGVALALLMLPVIPAKAQDAGQTEEPPAPTPAFEGQTGAPKAEESSGFTVEQVAERLNHPWSIAFLPDGDMLVTERAGFLRVLRQDGVYSAPIEGLPDVKVVGGAGLHDVVLHPDFENNRLVYFTYFAPPPGEAPATWPSQHLYGQFADMSLAERRATNIGTERLARARLSEDKRRLEDVEVLLDGLDRRIAFAPDGTLYISGAERFRLYDTDVDGQEKTYDPETRRLFSGRVARINDDGSIPEDNPFIADAAAPWDAFSFGHRDPEGAAIHPETGELWTVEHGPRGGDELNIIRAGGDYGWPAISYGRQYDLNPVGSGQSAADGMEQPIYYWYPSIAPSGMMFYTGDMFPEWQGDLFVGALAGQHLARLVLDGERVAAAEKLLTDLGARIRDVRQAPDGAIWVVTDDGGGIYRISQAK